MTIVKRTIIIVGVLVTAAVLLGFTLFSEAGLPDPTGPYKVGTHLFDLVDTDRNETLSPNDTGHRRIAVRVFYPAPTEAFGEFLPVLDPEVAKMFSKYYPIPSIEGSSRVSNSIIDTKAAGDGPFPVIIFSHGGFSFNTQNLSTMEELASNGYVVFAISHTYEAAATIFPGGEYKYLSNPLVLEESFRKLSVVEVEHFRKTMAMLQNGTVEDRTKRAALRHMEVTTYKSLRNYLEVRLDDIRFLMDSLVVLNEQIDFPPAGSLDLENIGLFGHSLGGVSASYICREENTPVKAGINMDAPVFLIDEDDFNLKRPFAFFYSTKYKLSGGEEVDMTGVNSYFAEQADEEVFSLSFSDAGHYNFSDFNMMPFVFKFTPMLGGIDGVKMARMMNRSVLDFFDYTLKGEKDTFYTAQEAPFSEVTLKVN